MAGVVVLSKRIYFNPLLLAPSCCQVQSNRSLKNKQLFKKKRNRKVKARDGRKYTVDHLYWDRYFQENPSILTERSVVNTKNIKASGKAPLSPTKIYETLTSADKRLSIAAVVALVSGYIGIKIIFS